jgi:hypothetical protein
MPQSPSRIAKLTPMRAPHEAASASAPALLFKPEPNRPWSIQLRRKVDDLSLVLNLLATIIWLPFLTLRDNAGTHVHDQPGDMMSVRDGSSVARTSPALVVTANQTSYVNEPLPLGMWLNNDSGKETVTIAGLAEGTELSLVLRAAWLAGCYRAATLIRRS